MDELQTIFAKIDAGADLGREELAFLLGLEREADQQALFAKAYQVKLANVGNKVYFRGLVEFGNICEKDCYYCGIRRGNHKVKRYQMTLEEIVATALQSQNLDYGSVVLQSGERTGEGFVTMVEEAVKQIKAKSDGKLGITLCLGEQSEATYRRWREAGAHRYLLRLETSNPELYAKLHPADHSYAQRRDCLRSLAKTGFQVGTGVLIGVPGQTLLDLADDALFFKSMDIDMIGMGPYIVHEDTPLAASFPDYATHKQSQLALGLKMIAVTRIVLRDVNIAATTALQALDDEGREKGLKAGANVIMPNLTATEYRDSYQLYEGKPCLTENAEMCSGCLKRRIAAIGETIGYGEWGDSPHYAAKKK